MESRVFAFGAYRSEVVVDEGFSLPSLGEELGARGEETGGESAGSLFVFDRNTHTLFGKDATESILLRPGEQCKSWQSVEQILESALEKGLARDSFFVAVGGGIVCDITAFAASVYMRGCRLILVPTTLLAMVDAGLGGKTGINFEGYKNMVGSFYPAEKIYIFPEALETLPEREYRSGLAEVIKTAMLGDRELYELLIRKQRAIRDREESVMREVIIRCIAVKGRIVEEDLREAGTRAFLNLGHTFAHALEAEQGLAGWTHGEAVAWGLAKAMSLGVSTGITNPEYAKSVLKLLDSYGFQTTVEGLDAECIVSAMGKDKKRRGGRLRIVLQKDLGQTTVVETQESELKKIIAEPQAFIESSRGAK
jgi:3-dehydroquinate synthase